MKGEASGIEKQKVQTARNSQRESGDEPWLLVSWTGADSSGLGGFGRKPYGFAPFRFSFHEVLMVAVPVFNPLASALRLIFPAFAPFPRTITRQSPLNAL